MSRCGPTTQCTEDVRGGREVRCLWWREVGGYLYRRKHRQVAWKNWRCGLRDVSYDPRVESPTALLEQRSPTFLTSAIGVSMII